MKDIRQLLQLAATDVAEQEVSNRVRFSACLGRTLPTQEPEANDAQAKFGVSVIDI